MSKSQDPFLVFRTLKMDIEYTEASIKKLKKLTKEPSSFVNTNAMLRAFRTIDTLKAQLKRKKASFTRMKALV